MVLVFLAPIYPEIVEKYYSNGLFVWIRYAFDYTNGLLPFSLFYFLLLFVLGTLFYRVFMWVRLIILMRNIPIWLKVKLTLISILSFASKILIGFFFLWGFNYFRVPVEAKIGVTQTQLADTEILIEFNRIRKSAVALRKQIKFKKNYIPSIEDIPDDLAKIVHKDLESALSELGYKPIGNPAMRFIKPDGFLYSFGVTGYYNPFLGEANMDKSFKPLYIPFLYAHELAHAYGIADEGEANFIAYLACERSSNKFVRYSGNIIYLQYLAHHIKNINIKWNPFIYEDLIMNGFFVYDPKYARMINLVYRYESKKRS